MSRHGEGNADREELDRLVSELPREIQPESDLWQGIRARLQAERLGGAESVSSEGVGAESVGPEGVRPVRSRRAERPLASPGRESPDERRGGPRRGPRTRRRSGGREPAFGRWGWGLLGTAMAAALAALLLVPGGEAPVDGESGGAVAGGAGGDAGQVSSAAVTGIEEAYEPAIQELQMLAASEDLSPETRREVEASLAVIDEAIREARDAVASDPAAPVAVASLKHLYDAKVEVLRTAALSY